MKTNGMKKGSALVTVLIATIVVGIVCTKIAMLTLQEYRYSWRSADYATALRAAESGIDRACQQFSAGGTWSNWGPFTETLPDGGATRWWLL